MKKILSIIFFIFICCYSCIAFASTYSIEQVLQSTTTEKVIANKQGKIINKITEIKEPTNAIYGEISFENTVYNSDIEKQLTEIYIMIPQDIINDEVTYELYIEYIESFAKKVYEKNINAKIGIIGIKGTISSHIVNNGAIVADENDEADIPGSAENAEIVSKLTNNIIELKNGLAGMNSKKQNYYCNLQAAIALANKSYSSNSNKILISLFDGVPDICNGVQNQIKYYEEESFENLVKAHNKSVVSATKNEILQLKDNNVAFILLRPSDASYNQTWYDSESGEVTLEYDGSEDVKELYGTMENPTYGKMYSLSTDSLEDIVTKYIYEDVIEQIGKSLENINIQLIFSEKIRNNFNIMMLDYYDESIDLSKLESEGKVTWNIDKINEGDAVTLKYRLGFKNLNSSSDIVNEEINLNNILISTGDNEKDTNLTDSPIIKILEENDEKEDNDKNNNYDDNNSNEVDIKNNNSNLINDQTVSNEKLPKAGKVAISIIMFALFGCTCFGLKKIVDLKDVK